MDTAYGSRQFTYVAFEPDGQETTKGGSKWTPLNLMSRFTASLPRTPTHLPQQKACTSVEPQPSSEDAPPMAPRALSEPLHGISLQGSVAAERNQTHPALVKPEPPQTAIESAKNVNVTDQPLVIPSPPLQGPRPEINLSTSPLEAAQSSSFPSVPLGRESRDPTSSQQVPNFSHVVPTSGEVARRPSVFASAAMQNDLNATQVQYSAETCELLDKRTFIAWQCSKPPALVEQWEHVIRPRLEDNLIAVMDSLRLRSNQIICRTQLEMVGPPDKKRVYVIPTVIITCGNKQCKREIQKVLRAGQFQCLTDFGQSVIVRFKPAPTWYGPRARNQPPDELDWFIDATTPKGTASSLITSQKESYQNLDPLHPALWRTPRIHLEDLSLLDSACGSSLRYESTDSIDRWSYSILGGLITIDGVIYGLTSAHPLLLNLDDNSDTDSIGTDSDDGSGVSADDYMHDVSFEGVAQDPSGEAIHKLAPFDNHQVQAKSPWIAIGRDGACSFGGWVAAMNPSLPDIFQNARRSAISDWTVVRADSMAGKRNSYRPAQEDSSDGQVEEKIITDFAQSIDAGDVHIVTHQGIEATRGFLTETTNSLLLRGSSLQVRQVFTQVSLGK